MAGDVIRTEAFQRVETNEAISAIGPTQEQLEKILCKMIDRGINISLADALASTAIVAEATKLWKLREERRLKEEEEEEKKRAETARRAEEERKRAAEKSALLALQKMQAEETPVSPEQIRAVAEATRAEAKPLATNISAIVNHDYDGIAIEEPIDACKKNFGSKLPEMVFSRWEYAVAFRGWLAKYKRPVSDALHTERRTNPQDTEYLSRLQSRMERFNNLFAMINEIITNGWRQDQKAQSGYFFFAQIEDWADANDSFGCLRECPAPLTAEEKQKQADEAKAREEAAKAREQLTTEIKNRLKNAGFSGDEAEAMSRSWTRKWDGELNATVVLAAKAVNKTLEGKADEAKKLANAAGLSDEEFEILVADKRTELARIANEQAKNALSNKGIKAGAATRNAPAKKEKNKKNNKKNGGKKEDRRK